MTVRYPAGDVTPHGWWHIISGTRPMMWLDAWDESVRIDMLGGLAPPYNDPMLPEAVALKSLKGLIPPWRHIDQKGATEDGVTQVDALLDPVEVDMVVECIGRDPKHLRRVHRDLIASIDAIQKSRLNFLDTTEMGHWWANIRWYKGAPPDQMRNPQVPRQKVSLRLRADTGCWQSYPDIATFGFSYDTMIDKFAFTDTGDAGVNWPIHFYEGAGAGHPAVNGSQLTWVESGTTERGAVIGPYKDFDTDSDNQVVEIELGTIPEVFYQYGAYNDIWGRMSVDGSGNWNGDGIRARVGMRPGGFFGLLVGFVQLARFNNFVETPMFSRDIFFWPNRGEKFRLVCGVDGDPRMFRIMRNGVTVLTHKEVGTGSALGAAFRGVGLGVKAATGTSSQKSPAWVQRISAGDNASIHQTGWLACTNIGDQKIYYEHTLFGPGTFRIYDGPASTDYVEFGPTTANQIVHMRTDPRSKGALVKDLTTVPSTPQEQNTFQDAIEKFLNFAFANNVPPLLGAITNIFGNKPPQGNLYKFLHGRFSDNAAIPAKSPGNPAKTYQVKVEIVGGNADSKIISSGTPLRRYPL